MVRLILTARYSMDVRSGVSREIVDRIVRKEVTEEILSVVSPV